MYLDMNYYKSGKSDEAMKSSTNDLDGDEVASEGIGWPAPLLDAVFAIVHQKWVIIAFVFFGVIIGALRVVWLPQIYTASAVAVLLPREKPALDAAIDTGSLEISDDRAGRSGSGNLMLPANPTLYTTLIKSRAVISEIAMRFGDQLSGHVSSRDRSDEVVGRLKSMIKVTSTEEGLITISVLSEDPQLSADIANALFEECQRASKSIEKQLLLRQAVPMEDAYRKASARLTASETRLMEFASKYELVNLDTQANNQLRNIRELSARKDVLKTDLNEALLSYSERSYEVQRLQARIASIEALEDSVQGKIVGTVGANGYAGLLVAYENLKQRVEFERDLVSTLGTKADIYRIRAEQPSGNMVVVRAALAPNRPSGPSKKRELVLALGAAVMFGLIWAFAIQRWKLAQKDVYISHRLQDLKKLLISTAIPWKTAKMEGVK